MNQIESDYKKEMHTIDIVWANVFGFIVLIPTVILFGIPYYFIWGGEFSFADYINVQSPASIFGATGVFMLIMIMGFLFHELIHGGIWGVCASKGFKSIKLGVMWKMLTPYCHCKEPLKVKHYIWGALGPGIVLGLLPAIWGLCTGNFIALFFGIFFIMAASGDILVVNIIRKEKMNDFVQDHPSEVGFYTYRKQD
ncbi:DUF3267 domain-containing protein [Labilibacter marinus]|uniref:DUF3267 domain-containing protein n=1 Tax=Labilibacter marinus TaxID=1477105 RepID=UPI00082A69C1|nr:DUF3267 domain-containing protein [Labilibacter marinus]